MRHSLYLFKVETSELLYCWTVHSQVWIYNYNNYINYKYTYREVHRLCHDVVFSHNVCYQILLCRDKTYQGKNTVTALYYELPSHSHPSVQYKILIAFYSQVGNLKLTKWFLWLIILSRKPTSGAASQRPHPVSCGWVLLPQAPSLYTTGVRLENDALLLIWLDPIPSFWQMDDFNSQV